MVPKGWKVKTIDSISDKIGSGVTPKGGESVYLRSGAPFIRSQNVGWGVLLLEDLFYLSDAIHSKMSSTVLRKNDVLLNITGASIGRSAIVDERIEGGNVNQHVCIIRPKTEIVNPFYLNQFLISDKGQKLIDSFQSGGNRQGLNFEQIKSFEIPIPPLDVQQNICKILSSFDLSIQKLSSLITKKELKKRALMQKLLTGEVRFKGFGKAKWSHVSFEEVFTFLRTANYSRENLQYDKVAKPVYYIHYGDIHSTFSQNIVDFNIETKVPILKSELMLSDTIDYLKDGDLVIADASEDYEGVGKCIELLNVGNKKVISGLHTFAVRDFANKTYIGFRVYLFQNPVVANELKKLATGSKVFGISKSNLSKLALRLPSIQEQEKIAGILLTADEEISKLKLQLRKLQEQKKGVIQLLLTGKVRVKV